MSDTPKAYKLNKEKRAAEEDGKFLYYFYDRKKTDGGCASRRAVR